jgi:hypothetical protein
LAEALILDSEALNSFTSAVIATGDPTDIARLSAGHSRVRVFAI